MDAELKVIEYNEAFKKRIALLTGKHINDVNDADFELAAFHHWKDLFNKVLLGETIKTIYESNIHGETIFEETILTPILDKDNHLAGISCFTRDVTQRKKYIRKIEAQNKLLQDIAWVQSHKVRSHVATLIGLQPLLDCERPENPDNRIVMEGIVSELAALDNVIKEINELTNGMRGENQVG